MNLLINKCTDQVNCLSISAQTIYHVITLSIRAVAFSPRFLAYPPLGSLQPNLAWPLRLCSRCVHLFLFTLYLTKRKKKPQPAPPALPTLHLPVSPLSRGGGLCPPRGALAPLRGKRASALFPRKGRPCEACLCPPDPLPQPALPPEPSIPPRQA